MAGDDDVWYVPFKSGTASSTVTTNQVASNHLVVWKPPPWYIFHGSRQPYGPRQLNPSITAVPANNPPGIVRNIVPIIRDRPNLYGPKPSPFIPGQSVDNPPIVGTSRASAIEIVQAAQPDPWVYDYLGPAGGQQPYGPRLLSPGIPGQDVDKPPIVGTSVAARIELVQAAQPDPWVFDYLGPAGGQQPYGPRQLSSTPGESVDNPPRVGTSVASLNAIIQIAQPDPWVRPYLGPHEGDQPYGAHKLSPGIPGQNISSPVPNEDALTNLGVILTAWQPPDPQPQQEGKLNPQLTAVEVDNPPAFAFPKISFIDDFILPPTGARLAPLIPAAVKSPFANFWLATVVAAWQPPAPQPQQQGNLNPSISAVRVDNPPFTYGGPYALRASIIALAQPDPWVFDYLGAVTGLQPYGARQLSAGIPGQSVNNPPVFLRQPLPLPLDVPFPQQQGKLAPGIPGQSVDQPPVLLRQPQPTQPDAPAPQQQTYVPQVTATVAQTPFSNAWIVTVLAAWQPPDPLPTPGGKLNPSITAVEVDNPPGILPNIIPIIRDRQWQQQQVFVPQVTAAVVQPPYTNAWIVAVSIWQPPDPQPTLPRLLNPSITAVEVDNPPFTYGGPYAVRAEIIQLAQPDPRAWSYLGAEEGLQPYGARKLNPSITAVATSTQPFSNVWVAPVVAAWQPPDPLPTLPRNLNPSITAVRVDNPPILVRQPQPAQPDAPPLQQPRYVPQVTTATVQTPYSNAWIVAVLAAWQPPDPLPTLPHNLNASIIAVEVDSPPGIGVPNIIVVEDAPLPQLPVKFVSGVEVDNPPFEHPGRTALVMATTWSAWDFPPPLPTLPPKLLQSAVVSTTSPFQNVWLSAVLGGWQPPDPLPTLPRNLNPSITAVEVDNPPVLVRQPLPLPLDVPPIFLPPKIIPTTAQQNPFTNSWLGTVLAAWQPPDPQPQKPGPFLVQPAGVPFTNTWLNVVLAAWQPPDPAPQQEGKLSPGIPGQSVDQPPVLVRQPQPTQLEVPAPQQAGRFFTPGVTVTNPPFTYGGPYALISEIIALAQPDPWVYGYLGPQEGLQPYGSRKLNPSITAVEVDNPPFTHTGRTALENLIVQAWIPPDPLPTLPISQVQPGPLTPPVVTQPPPGAGKRWPWPGIPEGDEKQSPSRRKSKRPVWDTPGGPDHRGSEQDEPEISGNVQDEDVGDGLKTILPPGTPRWDQIVPPLPAKPALAAKAKPKRRIALLSVTEVNDSLRAEFINSIAARALCKEQEDISARAALEDVETFVGSANASILAVLQKTDTDSFAGIGVHLGADDDDEALALLLD